ncbi:hypothetical protein ABG768_019112 [Culter alburnus]|uniref:HAT C-terminal dimerisation domain-containing protein n=1 Tax=Culter alburnus TaxID=194366 RepID=A0AAW2AWM2_CULAL
MASKKRKVDNENRVFNPAWQMDFAFAEIGGKPMCLICQKTIAVLKRANLQRHHEQLHPDFSVAYPQSSDLRSQKVQTLLAVFHAQRSMFRGIIKSADNITEASFRVAWNIAKAKRPATEGEFLKDTFMDCAESLFSEFKNKDDIIRQISKLQLSDSTVTRRVELISDDLFSQLLNDIESSEYFSLALDESTDSTDVAQLAVWVRFLKGEKFVEEMLTLLPLTGQTRGEDIHSALMSFFRGPGKNINMKKLVSVTTDGAPSMVGREKGLIALLRKDPDIPAFFSYHCILHQEQLCSKLKCGQLKMTMDTVTRTINFILAHALKHRHAYPDLTMHAEVIWLSRGNVLDRFMELLPVVRIFLKEKGRRDLLAPLEDNTFMHNVAFLTDVTRHLNALNLKLQGKQKILPMMLNDVAAFEAKLDLFAQQLQERNFTHFSVLHSQVTEPASFSPSAYCSYLRELKDEFSSRFADVKSLTPVLAFTENPFACDIQATSVAITSEHFNVERAAFEEQLIELQHNSILKERHKEESLDTFWTKCVLKDTYPALIQCAEKILTCFGSTYVCESAFSAMGIIKSKQRSRLSNRHLTDCLRAATSEQQPNMKLLVKKMQTQSSH